MGKCSKKEVAVERIVDISNNARELESILTAKNTMILSDEEIKVLVKDEAEQKIRSEIWSYLEED